MELYCPVCDQDVEHRHVVEKRHVVSPDGVFVSADTSWFTCTVCDSHQPDRGENDPMLALYNEYEKMTGRKYPSRRKDDHETESTTGL